jgi:hypothetical protein
MSRRSRTLAGAALVAGVLTISLVVSVMAYRARAGGGPATATPHYRSVEAALRARLSSQYLSYRWVVCTTMHQRFKGIRVSRCNVSFGDPHIQPYCAVLVSGALVTDVENPGVDCGPRVRASEQGISTTPGP